MPSTFGLTGLQAGAACWKADVITSMGEGRPGPSLKGNDSWGPMLTISGWSSLHSVLTTSAMMRLRPSADLQMQHTQEMRGSSSAQLLLILAMPLCQAVLAKQGPSS